MEDDAPSKTELAGGWPAISTVVFIVLGAWLATALAVTARGVFEDPPFLLTPG